MAQRDAQFVVGLTGPLGAGVTSMSKVLEVNGFCRRSLSDPIKEELRKRDNLPEGTLFDHRHLRDSRKRLQDIGNELRRESPTVWLDKAMDRCPQDGEIVIDSIRNTKEVEALRDRFPRFYLVAIHASQEVRWKRLQASYDNDFKAFGRDDDRDSHEEVDHGQQVEKCVLLADYVVRNEDEVGSSDSRMRNLFQKVKTDLDLMRSVDGPRTAETHRPPTSDEISMALAFAQSQSSRCLKRHVGAAIVDRNNFIRSMGFNENPIGMLPCAQKFNACYKDEDMHARLEQMQDVHCASCGAKITSGLQKPYLCACGESFKLRFFPNRNMELCTAVHAEERAIRLLRNDDAIDCTLFTTTFPCFQCSRLIVDVGIKRVVYVEAYPVKKSLDFLQLNGVLVEPFEGFKARAFNLVFRQVE